MLRWTFPYLLFVSLTALAGGVLNSYQKFALPAFTSVVLNIVMIVFAAWLSPYFEQPVLALAVGVFVGGVLQVADPGAGAAAAAACCAGRAGICSTRPCGASRR